MYAPLMCIIWSGCLVGKVREMKTFEKVRGWEVLTWESCREKCQDNEDCEEFRFKVGWLCFRPVDGIKTCLKKA